MFFGYLWPPQFSRRILALNHDSIAPSGQKSSMELETRS